MRTLGPLDEPIPEEDQDPRIQELDANRRRFAHDIRRLADTFGGRHGIIEDGVYRFYHQSIKVVVLYEAASRSLDLFERLRPGGCRLNPWFQEIVDGAERAWTGPEDLDARNANWIACARPVVELGFHCDYFLRQLVRYEAEEFASLRVLTSGVAAILYLYGLR